jgi:hypothetical protein
MSKSTAESLEQIEARLVKEAVAKATAQAKVEAEKQWGEQNKAARSKIEALIKELDVQDEYGLIAHIKSVFGLVTLKASKKSGGKRTRTTITDEIRTQVKALAKSGKKAPKIAKELGLSSPTVYNILKK